MDVVLLKTRAVEVLILTDTYFQSVRGAMFHVLEKHQRSSL
jgi:hypothetical protein